MQGKLDFAGPICVNGTISAQLTIMNANSHLGGRILLKRCMTQSVGSLYYVIDVFDDYKCDPDRPRFCGAAIPGVDDQRPTLQRGPEVSTPVLATGKGEWYRMYGSWVPPIRREFKEMEGHVPEVASWTMRTSTSPPATTK